jgi:hypothetical protein
MEEIKKRKYHRRKKTFKLDMRRINIIWTIGNGLFSFVLFVSILLAIVVYNYNPIEGARNVALAKIIYDSQNKTIDAEFAHIVTLTARNKELSLERDLWKGQYEELSKDVVGSLVPFLEQAGYHCIVKAGKIFVDSSEVEIEDGKPVLKTPPGKSKPPLGGKR